MLHLSTDATRDEQQCSSKSVTEQEVELVDRADRQDEEAKMPLERKNMRVWFLQNHEPPLGLARSVDLSWRYLLDQIDSLLEIHAEVNECPLNALAFVLLLLEDEHMVVEELLQFLVGEVDAQLLEAVELLDRVVQQRESMRTGGLSEEQRKKNREEQPSLMLFDDKGEKDSTDDLTRNFHRSITEGGKRG